MAIKPCLECRAEISRDGQSCPQCGAFEDSTYDLKADRMTDPVAEVAGTCMAYLLRDEPWQEIGFRRRPRHGTLVQLFRAKWRVRIEKVVGQEILILVTTAHAAAGLVDANQLDQVVNLYVAGPDGTRDLWKALGYDSGNDAFGHLRGSIDAYLQTAMPEWLHLTPTRIGALAIPDRAFAARLTVGAIRLAQAAQTMVLHLSAAGGGRPS